MRRKNEQEASGNGTGHIKFRVIEFEIDGGNDTLAEGIKALTTALSKSPVTTTVVSQRALPSAATKRTTTPAVADVEPTAEADEAEGDTVDLPEEEMAETNAAARSKRSATPPPTPDILSDIDLNGGKVSLRDFVAQKNPSETYARIATIAVWYQENHNIEEVNTDRIYTAYRFLDWIPPTDLGQALRNLKANKKWFDKGDARGGYKINMLGLNKVLEGFTE
jgi:hypothetical protein